MSNTELHQMLIILGRNPLTFQRDTPQLIKMIDNLESIQKDLKRLSEFPICKKQAE